MSLRHNIAKKGREPLSTLVLFVKLGGMICCKIRLRMTASTSFENLGKMIPEKKQIENEYQSTFSSILEEANF